MDEFDAFEIKEEKFDWEQVDKQLIARTSRGTYIIKQKRHLSWVPKGLMTPQKIGTFKNPKDKARRHFNEEAI